MKVRRYWADVAILSLHWLALIVFSVGFFQLSPSIPVASGSKGEGKHDSSLSLLDVDDKVEPVFNRMVFMVIDALREDFVFRANSMKWVRSTLQEGNGMGVIAVAKAPTVTLPRLKALTSGKNPRFLDILFNLASDTQIQQDSWVQRLIARNKSILHYGDDTWFRLFPNLLHPDSEGTHSFFVTDTVEVDRNVTRHLPVALQRRDWTALSLHYLGVDHVGHVGGAHSPLMAPKLEEMDGIAMEIYESLLAMDRADGKSSLFVIVGDHGMTDTGNHGGSSSPETETACIFLSPKYYSSGTPGIEFDRLKIIQQVDIAPTISLLLGLEIPRESTGAMAADLVPRDVALEVKLQMAARNAAQLSKVRDQEFEADSIKSAMVCHQDTPTSKDCLERYNEYIARKSKHLSKISGEYSVPRLIAGCALSILALLSSITLPLQSALLPTVIFSLGATLLFLLDLSGLHSTIPLLGFACMAIGWFLYRLCKVSLPKLVLPEAQSVYPLVVICAVYPLLMFSTTFIEEEQFYWYFATTTLLLLVEFKSGSHLFHRGSTVVLALILRILRPWNSTGNMMQGEPDMRNSSLQLQYFLLVFSVFSLCWLSRTYDRRIWSTLLTASLAVFVLFHKLQLLSIIMQRVALLLGLVLIGVSRGGPFYISLALTFTLMLKLHNATPLLALGWISVQLQQMSRHETAAIRLALIHTSFVVLGGSHLIAAIDLSPAYIGQARFRPLVTGVLGWCTTWAGPILCGALALTIPRRRLLLWRSISILALLASVGLQRDHLFVWSVFAPRLLFEFGWNLFYTILILCSSDDRE